MFDKFTERSRKVMALADEEAQRLDHEYVGTEHILLGLIKEGGGVAANILKHLNVDLNRARDSVEKICCTRESGITSSGRYTPRAEEVIHHSLEEAGKLNHHYVGTEHLLLGVVRETDSVAAQILASLGVELEVVRREVLQLLGRDED